MAVIGDANVGLVGAAFAADTLSLVVMSFRWRLLLRRMGSSATLWETIVAYTAGVCVCNITPARTLGGDAARAALIPRPGGSPSLKAVAASVVYDRLTDVAGFVLLGLVAAPVLKPSWPYGKILAVFAAITLIAALVAPLLYRRFKTRIAQWRSSADGAAPGRGAVAAAIGCSLLIWSLDITRIIIVGLAFGVRLAPAQAATISLLRLGSGVVPVPAGLGVVDGALVAGFIWLGFPAPTATAMAIVERAIVYGWGTALGALALLLRGGSRALQKARFGAAAFDLPSDAKS